MSTADAGCAVDVGDGKSEHRWQIETFGLLEGSVGGCAVLSVAGGVCGGGGTTEWQVRTVT